MGEQMIALGWDGEEVPLHSYVAYYYVDEEVLRRCLGFLRVGLDEPGTFCALVADEGRHGRLLDELQAGCDADVAAAREAGRLAVVGLVADFDALLVTLRGAMESVLAAGFQRARVLGLVGWGLSWYPDVAWLRRCEAEVGRVVAEYPMVAVHLYDVPGFADPEVADFGAGSRAVAVRRPDR